MVVESEPSLFVCLPTFVLEKDWQETTQRPVTRIRISKKPYLRCSVLSLEILEEREKAKTEREAGSASRATNSKQDSLWTQFLRKLLVLFRSSAEVMLNYQEPVAASSRLVTKTQRLSSTRRDLLLSVSLSHASQTWELR